MKQLLTLLAALAMTSAVFAQDNASKDYLNAMFEECPQYEALYVRTLADMGNGMFRAQVQDLSGATKMEGAYLNTGDDMLEHGKFTFYYGNGQVESQGYYEQGIKVGNWKRFTLLGEPRADRYYNPESVGFLRSVMDGKTQMMRNR